MPLLAATKDIYGLLDQEFTLGNTSLATTPETHTGKWSYDQSLPAIAVYNRDEGTIGGGNTDQTALSGQATGGTMQVRGGTVTVDAVAGTREDLAGAGMSGENLNPKQVRYELAAEVVRITQQFGLSGYESVAPGNVTDTVTQTTDGDVRPTYVSQIPVTYTYKNVP